jgi:hypothetical protein
MDEEIGKWLTDNVRQLNDNIAAIADSLDSIANYLADLSPRAPTTTTSRRKESCN